MPPPFQGRQLWNILGSRGWTAVPFSACGVNLRIILVHFTRIAPTLNILVHMVTDAHLFGAFMPISDPERYIRCAKRINLLIYL
ncbi:MULTISPECIES: hypothetical protein [unclassified Herbaspirillum]|uniref:hypothetical protein n=1 Tax=unclassified Herbaspirillum TaxID=2624150 RepID=UPI00115341F0|nr:MULTISPECIES: hypothetical protein [unclassified Herbaspirillum]MBB5392074.1 hypothetical protein [Herbaspirillum sp. SJZ102]